MKFLEKDLEDIIFEQKNEDLQKRGLHIYGNKLRQKRIGCYGVADIITYQRYSSMVVDGVMIPKPNLHITVYELKKDSIGLGAFLQALKYLKGIKSYIESRGIEPVVIYHIVLIGKSIDTKSSYVYLDEFIDGDFTLSNVLYEYDIDGLKFKTSPSYGLSYEGFLL